MHRWLLGLGLAVAFLLRTVSLSSYPVGFNSDEASLGYDAYSLLKTGKDQWGEPWPLTFRSFGDFKFPLYTYLAIPTVAIFGLNEYAVRLPNALLGTLAVLATYLLVLELFRQKRNQSPASPKRQRGEPITNHQSLAILAAFLLAISPWHISLSRGAFEANLTTFFMPLGAWAFLKGVERPRLMMLAALAFGLNMFSYHSARILTPLLLFGLIWWKRRELFGGATALYGTVAKYRWAVLVFLVFFVVAGYTMFLGAGKRGADVAIFNPTDRWASVSDRRYEAVLQNLPDSAARIFSNKAIYVFDQFIGGYFSYLSPRFLFTEGAGERTYGMIPGRGVLYLIEAPFILAALWAFIRRRDRTLSFVVLWILLAPIPAALAKGPGFAANRAATMMPAIQILSAYGAIVLWDVFKNRVSKIRKAIGLFGYWAIGIFIFTSLVIFLEDYRYHAPIGSASSMLYGREEAVEFTSSIEDNYKEIVFSRSLSEPHIFVAFYNKWDPEDYQNHTPDWLRYEKEGRSFLDQLGEYRLGKYTFTGINKQALEESEATLFIGNPNEFLEETRPLQTIYYPNGEPAILIVDPAKEVFAIK